MSTITTSYDSRGSAISETTDIESFDASPLTLSRGFDAVGALTSLEYPSGRQLEFVREGLDRVEVVRHLADGDDYPGSASGAARDLVTITHVGNRISKVERENAYGTLVSYDGAGRLVELHHTSVGDTALRSQQLHDAARNPRVRIELGPTSTQGTPPPERADNFGYDSQYQLIARAAAATVPSDFVDLSAFLPASVPPSTLVERQSLIDAHLGSDITTGADWWAYDLVGNRTASELEGAADRSYEPNIRDQYAEVDSVTYAYDAAGNLLTDGTYHYRYDAWRRLCRVIEVATDATIASYAYDGHGRRIVETHASATDPLYIAYDGADRIADYRADSLVAVYTHGDTSDAPLHAAVDGSELWFHSDHQGSVRAVTDGDGKTVASYRYDPYGNLVFQDGMAIAAPTASDAAQPFGFGSRPFVPTVALYDQRARSYSPSLGRFLQRDPAGDADGTNLYLYAGNEPMGYGDTTGFSRTEHASGWFKWGKDFGNEFIAPARTVKETLTDPSYYWDQVNPISNVKRSFWMPIDFWRGVYDAGSDVIDVVRDQDASASARLTRGTIILVLSKKAPEAIFERSLERSFIRQWTRAAEARKRRPAAPPGVSAPRARGTAAPQGTPIWRRFARFFWDSRDFEDISREYWRRRGGAGPKGAPAALRRSLDHWLIPRRAKWLPLGLQNAGFNLIDLPAGPGWLRQALPRGQGQNYNTWKGFAQRAGSLHTKAAAHAAEWGQRAATIVGVPLFGDAAERTTGISEDDSEDGP